LPPYLALIFLDFVVSIMQKMGSYVQAPSTEFEVAPIEFKGGLNLPVTGEGVSADEMARLVSSGQERLTAQYANESMAEGMSRKADPFITERIKTLSSLTRQQHDLLGRIGEAVSKSGRHEL
jgi:hypothetical protein